MTNSQYVPTIGIETHVQLKTKTKLFSAVGNDARQAPPNTLISHIDVGLPGALPVLNQAAIELCARAALALNTDPQKFSWFERKHYFYPDLPKGYQITQYQAPIIKGGFLEIEAGGRTKKIKIERANLEEDAGKNIHPAGADYTLIDLNRAGTPLLEIVSRPEINSAAEAKAYVRELWLLMKYADVTDGDLYHGHMRFDINVSVARAGDKLGTRSEIKNLNSFRSVEAAVAYEIKRQIELLEKGQKVIQETRGWDEAKQKSVAQRGKEEAEDYRYMPEPDIPPLELTDKFIEDVKAELPKLPPQLRRQLDKLGIDKKVTEDILDRQSIVKPILDVLAAGSPADARRVAFWLIHAQPAETEKVGIVEPEIDSARLISLSKMVDGGELSSTAAKAVFDELLSSPEDPMTIAKRLNLLQVTDTAAIEKIVEEVITENPKVAEDIKQGEMKAIGFLVGQVMTKSQGQANPKVAQELIKKQLDLVE
ncbi:glutaminyl-tRNA synthase (glutamine-hydrolyzing) subunit B [Candidatus Saccharibacteria bacterium RIFCSPHIGHO2_12_FULL_47_16b]|nr:MAG: glutaminyl-tRNA synthase (glutamine-hydrolyzing) subunit B [Candidatus Saccharibacteria bacterium RIFCSPHIGHO2_12_FULL_47_16b]